MAQKGIKGRISSVKNIQKITRAMEMVAAARLRRAEQRTYALRPYAAAIRRMTRQAASAAEYIPNLPILTDRGEYKNVGILLLTADRGLAGAFNSQIVRAGVRLGDELKAEGKKVTFYVSGRRGDSSLRFRGNQPVHAYTGFSDRPSYANARRIAQDITLEYDEERVDRIEIVYNSYISPLVQRVMRETLLPLRQATILSSEEDGDVGDNQEQFDVGGISGQRAGGQQVGGQQVGSGLGAASSVLGALVEYEPDPEEILNRLIPTYIEISVFRALLESTASEHGARMTAMRNASENAGELIQDLTLLMNRQRQAEITQEIMEVVAGAESLV